MTTDAFEGKKEGIGIIKNALWGLLLVIGSYLILYTINPRLLQLGSVFTNTPSALPQGNVRSVTAPNLDNEKVTITAPGASTPIPANQRPQTVGASSSLPLSSWTGSGKPILNKSGSGGSSGSNSSKNNDTPNRLPSGNLGEASCTSMTGWAYDPDSKAVSISVQIYQGPKENGGKLLSTVLADRARKDINDTYNITGNHGFVFTVPASLKDNKQHQIYAYAIDKQKPGVQSLLGNSPRTIQCQK